MDRMRQIHTQRDGPETERRTERDKETDSDRKRQTVIERDREGYERDIYTQTQRH